MSDFGFQMDAPPPKRRHLLAIAVGIPLLVITSAIYLGARLAPPPDYTGAGDGTVEVIIEKGDTLREIGQTLLDPGAIASLDAWLATVAADPDASGIGPGKYEVHSRMSAANALQMLLDPTSRNVLKLVVREGDRVSEVIDNAAEVSGIARDEFVAALRLPKTINLPESANGKPEGYLFPATYEIDSTDTATTILQKMTARWKQAAGEMDLKKRAAAAGHTVEEILTIASILEVEAGVDDYGKVARVIENRLALPMRLQLDSTVNYALGISKLQLTTEQMNHESDYNTYQVDGLPPGPIGNPGQLAIEAALAPVSGPWLYFVTVDPANMVTKFCVTYEDFLVLKEEFKKNVS